MKTTSYAKLEKFILYCVVFGPRYQNSILRMEIQIIYWLQLYKKRIRHYMDRYSDILLSSPIKKKRKEKNA